MGRLGRISQTVQSKFIGRRKEQQAFVSSVKQLLEATSKDIERLFPQAFLIYGEGGMGKSTLADRFISICAEEDKQKKIKVFKVDWEDYEAINSSAEMMDILCDKLSREFPNEFKKYKAKRLSEKSVQRKVEDARQQFEPLVSAVAEGVSNFTATGNIGKATIEAFVHTAATELAKREDQFHEWLKKRLEPDEYLLFKRPQLELSKEFVKALTSSAKKYPVVLVFDTYEFVDKFDSWVREGLVYHTLDNSSKVLCIISGRYDHSTAYRNTLPDDFLYLIDLREFSKPDIED